MRVARAANAMPSVEIEEATPGIVIDAITFSAHERKGIRRVGGKERARHWHEVIVRQLLQPKGRIIEAFLSAVKWESVVS